MSDDDQAQDDHPAQQKSAAGKQKQQQQQQHQRRCLVCYTERTASGGKANKGGVTTILPCGHDEICGICHLRLRYLHNDKKCPICKTVNEQVIVDYSSCSRDDQQQKVFDQYPVWGEDLGNEFVYNQETGMFFPVDYYHSTIKPLFGYHCTKPGCDYDGTTSSSVAAIAGTASSETNKGVGGEDATKQELTSLRALKDHLRTEHRLTLCQLCVDHKRDFVARLPRFSPSGLQKHLVSGNGKGSGFEGHPVCEFCRPVRFYDITALHQHLQKEHYKCHICEQQDLPNQYFKNYRSLERHFDNAHFLCHDVQCLTARFVVFRNELDLRHHERQVHGGTSSTNTKIQLEFKVARSNTIPSSAALGQEAPDASEFNYNLDGQAFVPAALPQREQMRQSAENAQLHPLHVLRTEELRQQAAMIRQNSSNDGQAAFPSLQETAAATAEATTTTQPQNRLNIGWTSDATIQRIGRKKDAGAVTEEDFPSLKPPEKKASPAAAAKLASITTKKKTTPAISVGWTSAPAAVSHGATSAAAAGPVPSSITASFHSSSFTVPSSRGTISNSAANLTADNFPSLGGGSSATLPARYTAANELGKKNLSSSQKNTVSNLAANNFPALSGGGGAPRYAAADAFAQNQAKKKASAAAAPQFDSTADFPPTLVSASAAAVSVEDMKASLGPAQYKKLKKFTKDFASGELQSDAYVDHAASLFDNGYADPDFWNFVPALVASCPSAADNDAALRYMDNLKRMRNGALNAESLSVSRPTMNPPGSASTGGWSAKSSNVTAAPPTSPKRAQAPVGRYVPPPQSSAYPQRLHQAGKKQNAWGGSDGASTVARAKAPPGSVAVAAAAAAAAPSTATATKFMAKEAKQEKWQQAGGGTISGKSKKKNKQKNELRSLAFGS